jgi:hypothetical protein
MFVVVNAEENNMIFITNSSGHAVYIYNNSMIKNFSIVVLYWTLILVVPSSNIGGITVYSD